MKQVFQKGKERRDWLKETVANPLFDEATCYALSEYASRLGTTPGDEHKIAGATQIISVLKDLPNAPVTHQKIGNRLNYNA